jgi:hypothetical protein
MRTTCAKNAHTSSIALAASRDFSSASSSVAKWAATSSKYDASCADLPPKPNAMLCCQLVSRQQGKYS